LSFFDEDDEPTRPRRSPRPRRAAAPAGASGVDQQTLLVRRGVAVAAGVIVLILLVLLINACQDSRRKNALRDWNREASTLIKQSDDDVGRQFFDTLRQGSSQSPEDLTQQVSSLRAQAETQLQRAKDLDTPGDLDGAAQSLLIALEQRQDGLEFISGKLSAALGKEGDVADKAVQDIAGQMQAFLASDVLIRTRVTPVVRQTLGDNDVVADAAATKGFLPGLAWLTPSYVASQLGTRLSNTGSGRPSGGTPAPGLHGSGLTGTEVDGVKLTPGAANRVPISGDLTFTVTFQNQGDNDEFDIPVTVALSGGPGKPINARKTVDTVASGATATVNIALPSKPTAGEVYTVKVSVTPVPGEKNTTNNSATYSVLFQ
jgi:hypothetical protein